MASFALHGGCRLAVVLQAGAEPRYSILATLRVASQHLLRPPDNISALATTGLGFAPMSSPVPVVGVIETIVRR
jgi:hypothetical protein